MSGVFVWQLVNVCVYDWEYLVHFCLFSNDVLRETEIFSLHHAAPFSKMLTFFRKEPFELDAKYTDSTAIGYPEPKIGKWAFDIIEESAMQSELSVFRYI